MEIKDLIEKAHKNSCDKGFWGIYVATDGGYGYAGVLRSDNETKGLKIALMHSELSEALEGIRKDLKDDHLPHLSMEVCELADVMIRIADYVGAYGLPLEQAIKEKMQYNSGRPFLHGKKF